MPPSPAALNSWSKVPSAEAGDDPPGPASIRSELSSSAMWIGWRYGISEPVPRISFSVTPADQRQRHHRVDVGPVLALHPVRVEDQVVAHPDRVEAVLLGGLGPADQLVARGLLAEVRQQQPVPQRGVGHTLNSRPVVSEGCQDCMQNSKCLGRVTTAEALH